MALLCIAPVLSAGCGGTSSSPGNPHASSSPSELHAPASSQQPAATATAQAALARLATLHGRAYVEAAKNLPDQVETR